MTQELQEKILDGMQQLATASNEQAAANEEYAMAEFEYRQARAKGFAELSIEKIDGKKRTDTHIDSLVDIAVKGEMLRVRLAEARRDTANELIRSLRAQLSAGQSLLGAVRAEVEALRYGQTAGA